MMIKEKATRRVVLRRHYVIETSITKCKLKTLDYYGKTKVKEGKGTKVACKKRECAERPKGANVFVSQETTSSETENGNHTKLTVMAATNNKVLFPTESL